MLHKQQKKLNNQFQFFNITVLFQSMLLGIFFLTFRSTKCKCVINFLKIYIFAQKKTSTANKADM